MRIREGKRYVTRDGRVTGPIVRGDIFYEAEIDGTTTSWFRAGRWSPWGPHDYDLIAEYKEPQS